MEKSTLKLGSLVILALQTSAFVLVARRSRLPDEQGNVYFAGTAVFLMELTKLVLSTIMLVARAISRENNSPKELSPVGYVVEGQHETASTHHSRGLFIAAKIRLAVQEVEHLVWTPSAVWLAIPAAAYVAQNNLQLTAATHLEPALFQTFIQAKLMTTAGFSVLMMKRSLNNAQWASIALLAFGLTVVHQSAEPSSEHGRGLLSNTSDVTIGFVLMMGAALLSGFAGVFTERILKQDKDFWATNFHMSLFSMLPALTVIISARLRDPVFEVFSGFGVWAWSTVLLNAVGGLLVSMVLKYADSIAKGFSLAAAVILTVMLNFFFLHAKFSFGCLMGILTVLLSTTLYVTVGSRAQRFDLLLPSHRNAENEKLLDDTQDNDQACETSNIKIS